MATTLPQPAWPSAGPPTSALPALPVPKTRKSLSPESTSSLATPARTRLQAPRSGLRSPSSPFVLPPTTTTTPAPSTAPTTALPQPRSVSMATRPAVKTLRKTVSINSFPQPPKGDNRVTSFPPSTANNGTLSAFRKSKTGSASSQSLSGMAGIIEGKSAARTSARFSDGLISVPSPPQSRSSSAQDSYSTSASTFDEPTEGQAKPAVEAPSHRLSKSDGKGNVVVSVRVRPDAGGQDHSPDGEWMVDGRRSLVAYKGKEGGDYFYDNVFTTHDDNSRVYDHLAKRLVRRVMEGYHGTVFAYGMTGTGKTFSMQGTASSPGVIPLAITDIFSYIRETPSREFLLRVSYLEIYNERIHDLLSMPTTNGVGVNNAQEEIKLREDSKRGVYATPLKEEIVQSPTQLLRVISRGDQARRTASTQFNARSSRSHAVVQIVVESRERVPGGAAMTDSKRSGLPPGGVRVSTLSLIDLAGSEKAAETKERRAEGSHINKSLLTLGTVIANLSDHKDKDGKSADKAGKHLPYRDSKLTRLLQGALAGDSLVSILCTIQIGSTGSAAAANSHTTETINTLKFASRAKNNIVSHAKRAEEALGGGGDGGARVLLERYRMEILELRKQIEDQARPGGGGGGGSSTNKVEDSEETRAKDAEEDLARKEEAENRHEEQMLEMHLARTALKERIDHLNKLILSSRSTGVNASGSYSSLSMHQRNSQQSARSARSSMGAVSSTGKPPLFERSASATSSSSTIGRRSTSEHRISSGGGEKRISAGSDKPNNGTASPQSPIDAIDDDDIGEFGDGVASLTAQNQALQVDLVDKNRYIATLEKRLLQARRASSSRASVGLSAPIKGIMVGEDHSVSAVLKEKDVEIADLRARLDDKDRMLAALRSAARSRDNAESRSASQTTIGGAAAASNGGSGLASPTLVSMRGGNPSSPPTSPPASPFKSSRNKSGGGVDEMSRILDEMIQDRVETGHIVRGARGSVRVAPHERGESGTIGVPMIVDAAGDAAAAAAAAAAPDSSNARLESIKA